MNFQEGRNHWKEQTHAQWHNIASLPYMVAGPDGVPGLWVTLPNSREFTVTTLPCRAVELEEENEEERPIATEESDGGEIEPTEDVGSEETEKQLEELTEKEPEEKDANQVDEEDDMVYLEVHAEPDQAADLKEIIKNARNAIRVGAMTTEELEDVIASTDTATLAEMHKTEILSTTMRILLEPVFPKDIPFDDEALCNDSRPTVVYTKKMHRVEAEKWKQSRMRLLTTFSMDVVTDALRTATRQYNATWPMG